MTAIEELQTAISSVVATAGPKIGVGGTVGAGEA